MNCQDCQNAVSNLMDSAGNLPLDLAVERHLAECDSCRDFRMAWSAIETPLAGRFANVPLPADFKASLFARLPALEPRLTPGELAARRKELEQEYRKALASLNRRYLFPQVPGILRVAGLTAGWSVAGLILAGIIFSLPFMNSVVSPAAAALAAQIACSAIGLMAGIISLRRNFRHLLRSVLPPSFRRLTVS